MVSVVSMVIDRSTADLSVDKANRAIPRWLGFSVLSWVRKSKVSFMKMIRIQIGAPIKAIVH